MAAMTDAHRLIVQTFMSRGILSEKEFENVIKHACDHFRVNPLTTDRLIRDINPNIQSVSMEIRSGKDEVTGDNLYVLVRMTESEIGRLSSDFQPNDLELFKKMMDLIIESDSGVASSTDILNLTNDLEKRMSKADAEMVLRSLVRDKWLTDEQGEISLSSRAIVELEHYLQDVYQDEIKTCNMCKKIVLREQGEISLSNRAVVELKHYMQDVYQDKIKTCNMCKTIVLRGSSCGHCHIRMHFYCARRYFTNKTHVTCPACKRPWTDEFASTDDDEEEPQPSTSRKRGNRRV